MHAKDVAGGADKSCIKDCYTDPEEGVEVKVKSENHQSPNGASSAGSMGADFQHGGEQKANQLDD